MNEPPQRRTSALQDEVVSTVCRRELAGVIGPQIARLWTMRLVAGALALTLFASFARAEDTRIAEPVSPTVNVTHGKVPLRVVDVMARSHQALLFDRARATHVLVEVGAHLDGYIVEAIDDDEVTLSSEGKLVVLAAPARGNRHRDRDMPAMHSRSAADATQTDMAAGNPIPIDPYGEAAIRVVEAPGPAEAKPAGTASRAIEAGEGGVRVAAAPGSTGNTPGSLATSPAPDARALERKTTVIRVVDSPAGVTSPRASDAQTADPKASTGQDAIRVAEAPAGPPSAPAVEARIPGPPPASGVSDFRTVSAAPGAAAVLTRGDVDDALADFAKLATAVRGRFSASGLVIDAVREGSIFQRAGLRAGDVITAVDGAPLRSLDDAANLYARASTTKAITAQILRGGTSMALHVEIQERVSIR